MLEIKNNIKRIRTLRDFKLVRRNKFQAAVRESTRPMLNSDGSWNIKLTKESGRLDLQLCTAFYYGDAKDIDLANRLTRRAPIPVFNGNRFDIFQTSIACHHLAVFRDKMDAATISWCEQVIFEGCAPCPGTIAPDLQFHGYNDNMPAMATKTLVLGGEMLNREDWIEVGLWKLRRLGEQLTQWGMISEYNSPNYTLDTIHNLMTLATYTKNEECKLLAEKIVCRIWLDLAAHWHPAARCPAGPFSRAYEHDFNNYLSSINCFAWILFGSEVSGISAMETISPRKGIEAMHGNDPLEHMARMAWYAITDDSLLDDKTAVLFIDKPMPFELIASTVHGDSGESPLRKTTANTFINKDYSLGSASFGFCGGEQTTSLYATGRNGDISPVMGFKYLVDDESPGRTAANDWHRLTVGSIEYMSYATAVTVQHQETVLASYVPHRNLSVKELSYLRLAIIAPNAIGQFDGFINAEGESLLVDHEYSVNAWYGTRLGTAIVAFHPLAYSAFGLPEAKVRVRHNDRYDYLEIVNYDGEARYFSREELSQMQNGVTFEIASNADWRSPEEFIQALSAATVFEDQFIFGTRRLRYYRSALPDRQKVMLMLNYSTAFDGCAERIVNGKVAPEPVWQCTGIAQDSLPFMGKDGVIAVPGLPWDNLTVHWVPNKPWAINKHGNGKI